MLYSTNLISEKTFQTFGDLLKFLRHRARLTQRELSIAVNYSEAQISRLERNRRPPNLATLTSLFVPALYLEDEPEMILRLLELAAHARDEELPHDGAVSFVQSIKGEIEEEVQIIKEDGRNNFPYQLTSFIEREGEFSQLINLFMRNENKARLITLTGSGGCGKTRLALETAGKLFNSFRDGVWLIELTSILNPLHVDHEFLSSLGLPEPREESPTEAIIKFLQNKHLLLIVDNCEHLLPKVSGLIKEILLKCAHVQIMATSREILDIPGEVRYSVPPLTIANNIESESFQLFLERTKTVHPKFELTDDNANAVAQICQRVDGLPLAIELAAAKTSVLTVHQIASHLNSSFQLLTGGIGILERHRTMEATIRWSYEMLSNAERTMLNRLSIFSGGWTLESAKAVVSDQVLVPSDIFLELLSGLVNKSMIMVKRDAKFEARYEMLQIVYEFAYERLTLSGEMEELRERHFHYFKSMAEQGEAKLYIDSRFIDWIEAEINNYRLAFNWSLENKIDGSPSNILTGQAMEIMSQIHTIWFSRGYFSEGKELLEKLLAVHTEATLARARALVLASVFMHIDGDHSRQLALTREALTLSQKLKDRKHIAWSLCWLGYAERDCQNYSASIKYLIESLAILKELNELIWVIFATHFLAESYVLNGELETARDLWNQGIELCREEGYEWQFTWGLEGLGTVEKLDGNYEQARKLYSKSLRMKVRFNDTAGIAYTIGYFALLAAAQKHFRRAVKLWAVGKRLRHTMNHLAIMIGDDTTLISEAQIQLGQEIFNSTWSKGAAMSIEDAIDYALSKEDWGGSL
jgi:predicted ATPase/DNA-binding XRE family transcriptional regulator